MTETDGVENSVREGLDAGLAGLGLDARVSESARVALGRYAAELLRWNAKVNLTAIVDPREVAEKHLVDSLAMLPEVAGAATLLDLGAGAGLPGLALALAVPELRVTLVDTVGKKVAFMKHCIAHLGLTGRVVALHARVEGAPERERVPLCEVVASRAFMDVARWLTLAVNYRLPRGRVVAMLGRAPTDEALGVEAARMGLSLAGCRRYELPTSRDPRAVACFT